MLAGSFLGLRALLRLSVTPSRGFSTSSQLLKLKTHHGAKKRWSALPGGLFKRGKAGRSHLNSHMPSSRLNRLGQTAYSTPTQARTLRRLLPYA
ncbi:hypothetical protein DL93DRAFT_2074122 [Clavulina sp. PMI_390]|nr:hypothetical protein DL93DRAFT_2074122 [Clavulina sp. PMI_390]